MVVPHGVPDRPYVDPDLAKPRFRPRRPQGAAHLRPALAEQGDRDDDPRRCRRSCSAHPDTVYVIAGATHPHLLAREGERYRASAGGACRTARRRPPLRWLDTFLDQEQLLDLIEAADLYVTPYLNLAQITSGTLSYAVALGKPVVSTPYHHAAEIVGPRNGLLVEPGDAAGFAAADDLAARRRQAARGDGRIMPMRSAARCSGGAMSKPRSRASPRSRRR